MKLKANNITMSSTKFLTTSTMIGSIAIATCSCANGTGQVEYPNVIYILVDDLGYADLGCYGQQIIQTPHIDAMAANGVQFTQHYAGCTVSAPSRCALMTGKHTGHTYVRGNKGMKCTDGRVYDTAIPAEEFTLAELFKQRDYATACIGKWGLGGPETSGAPNNQGFDYFYGYLGQGFAHNYYPDFLHENNAIVCLDGKEYSHDLIEQKALNFITQNQDNPFFLYLTFTIPHAELLLPDEYMEDHLDKYEETPFVRADNGSYSSQEQPRAAFASMVERMDNSVGTINSLLKELGIDENTLVIFSSDNGAHHEGGADPQFFNSTGVYRGVKRDLYEGGIRVPMIAYWNGVIPAGVKNDEISAFWDMMPTFADLIGVDAPDYSDGVSILPALYGEPSGGSETLYWEFHEQGGKQAVRQGDWKLIRFKAKNKVKSYYELYNVVEDPSEKSNLASQRADLVELLSGIMDSSRAESSIFEL